MTLADDLSDVKPADNFDSDQIVDKGFLDGQLPPLATFQASSESAKATEDLRNISRGRRVQLGFGESVELTKLRLRSCKKRQNKGEIRYRALLILGDKSSLTIDEKRDFRHKLRHCGCGCDRSGFKLNFRKE